MIEGLITSVEDKTRPVQNVWETLLVFSLARLKQVQG